ncbi:hypothetical protein [Rhizobium sp. A37_96]
MDRSLLDCGPDGGEEACPTLVYGSYAKGDLSAEGSEHHESYEDALDAVTKIVTVGKIARFLVPATASQEQSETFNKLGPVQRI